jgi:hypothetical protein
MKKILLSLVITFALIAPNDAAAAVRIGGSCKKAGKISIFAGNEYKCITHRGTLKSFNYNF